MSAIQPDACVIGLTPETLSQWRDRVLDIATTRTIAQHIDTCAACQAWLQSFEATAQQLRQRYVPPSGTSLWREVQQRIASAERQRRHRPTLVWRGLGAAVAALLIGALFAYALRGHLGTTARPATSPTALAPISLPWQAATTPPGIDNFTLDAPAIAFTSADSKSAYVCFPGSTNGAVPQVWTTHDSGATNWRQLASPPASGALDGCSLVVDSVNANSIVAIVGAPIVKPSQTKSFVSLDGGQQWRPLSGWSYGEIQQSATAQNVTYLLGGDHLGITRDNWQSWSLIDGAITAAGESVARFWVDPATGAILVLGNNIQANTGATTTGHLWQTSDGGNSWRELALTPTFDYGAVFAQPPTGGHPWQICGQRNDNTAGNVHPYDLECSRDGGQSWQERTPLERTSNGLYVANERLVGLAHDGALIEETGTSAGLTLYRQAAGATTWQSLGSVPGTNDSITLVDDGTQAVLWTITTIPVQIFTVTYL